jgi:hypothetical protein
VNRRPHAPAPATIPADAAPAADSPAPPVAAISAGVGDTSTAAKLPGCSGTS